MSVKLNGMSSMPPPVDSPWGPFTRGSYLDEDGKEHLEQYFVLPGRPDLVLQTPDQQQAAKLLKVLESGLIHLDSWQRTASDAIVSAFSGGALPTEDELEQAAADLVLETVVAHGDKTVGFHFTDSCEEHFLPGSWPSVRMDRGGEVLEVWLDS